MPARVSLALNPGCAGTRRARLMTPEAIEAYVDAAAVALDLPLAAEHRPGVLRYFALAASMAELVGAHPLGLADEPAPVFVPVSPPAVAADDTPFAT